MFVLAFGLAIMRFIAAALLFIFASGPIRPPTTDPDSTCVKFVPGIVGAPVLPMTFDSTHAVNLVLDSGTSVNILSDQIAMRLGLQTEPITAKNGKPIVLDGKPARVVKVPTVLIGDFELSNVPFFILPSSRVAPLVGPSADGILGGPFVKAFPMLIDFLSRKITFWSDGSPTDQQLQLLGVIALPKAVELSPWMNDYRYEVNVRFNDTVDEKLIVDTGAGVTIVSSLTAQRLNLVLCVVNTVTYSVV